MKKIVTHDSDFHADDAFAVATLEIYLDKIGEKYKIIRSREKDIIETGDYVLDVGSVYDDEQNKFDHHQDSFKETGYMGVPYSTFGLIWKHFGREVCENKNVWQKIRNEFVTIIDANDNGIITATESIKGIIPQDPEVYIFSFRPKFSERTDENLYKGFLMAVEFAKGFLLRIIAKELDKENLRDEFEKVLKSKKNISKTDSLKCLILPKPLPWKDFIDEENDLDFVIMERENGQWMATGVPPNKNTMRVKVVKKSWVGLSGDELSEKVGVKDMVFYHKTGYILVAKTKEAIMAALEKF